jgi:NADPH:quinone reductase
MCAEIRGVCYYPKVAPLPWSVSLRGWLGFIASLMMTKGFVMTAEIPDTMRAIIYAAPGGPEVIRLERAPTPRAAAGQALIRVGAAGVNFADIARRYNRYLEPTTFPYKPGSEIVGEIVELGPGVAEEGWLRLGARVMGMCPGGGYAEYVVTSPRLLAPAPAQLPDAEAAALPVQGLTAYHLFKTSTNLQPGERVLINAAAGGVGTLALQVARLMGAGLVIAAVGSDDKADLLQALGADAIINYATEDLTERVRALTGGEGADVILEPVGGEVFNQSLAALAPWGRLATFGQASGKPGMVDTARLMRRNASVVGFWLAVLPSRMIGEGAMALATWVAEGKLRVVVGATYPLEEAAQAQRDLEARRTRGKLALMAR